MTSQTKSTVNQSLVKFETSSGPVALSPEIIKRYLVNGNGSVTDQEVMMFLNLCRYQSLNPFLREVYLIKYGNAPATMVTGKETFTKRAARHPEFDGFKAGVVIEHDGSLEYREGSLVLKPENLVGGWAEVYRKDRNNVFRVTVSLDEYMPLKDGRPQAMWAKMPGSQIRKVALVGALREAFPEEFGGMYSTDEMAIDETRLSAAPVQFPEQETNDAPTVEPPSEPKATEVQLKKIYAMFREYDIPKDVMHDIIKDRYGKSSSKELSKADASDLITYLDKLAKGEELVPDHGDAWEPREEDLQEIKEIVEG